MHHLLYHANCADGFASAVIAQNALTTFRRVPADQIRLQPVNYSDPSQLPETWHMGDHIYYLDYTPPQNTLDILAHYGSKLITVTIIDHHSTAAPRHENAWFTSVFDLSMSGALLTWKHFHAQTCIPDAIQLISWRDLGHAFQQPNHYLTEPAFNLHATLMRATARTAEAWEAILFTFSNVLLDRSVSIGRKIRAFDKDIIDMAALKPLWLSFDGQRIPAITGFGAEIISEALAAVLLHHPEAPFAASWYVDAPTGLFTYSLRSRKDGPNVAEIAASMAPGGGGHPCAAGFSTPTPIPFAE